MLEFACPVSQLAELLRDVFGGVAAFVVAGLSDGGVDNFQ